MINVLLADDHLLFRKGLHRLLSYHHDINIIAEADNGQELLEQLEKHKPDVAVIDLSMPGVSGLRAMEVIQKDFPEQYFIILSMHVEKEYIIKSIQSGAKAYLLKDSEEEELLTAIRAAAAGDRYYTPMVEEAMKSATAKIPPVYLTKRELQIINMLANGMSTKIIADKLFISKHTVETHRVNIMNKMDADNTAQLIKKGIKAGYISDV